MAISKFRNRLYHVCRQCGLAILVASGTPADGAEVWLTARGELAAAKAPAKCPACGMLWQGFTADSGDEARRYGALLLLERAGRIRKLQVHPRHTILPAFHDRHGRRHEAVEYEADFAYLEGGEQVVEDVKGPETAVWKLKEKLFLYTLRHLELRVIPAEDVR